MARYPADQFAEAAVVYFEKFGLVPSVADALEQVVTTKANAAALATELGEGHAAHKALVRVATLRDSIAKRFIRLSVAPLAAAQTPKQAQARKAKETANAAAEPTKPARQNRAARRAAAKSAPAAASA